MDARHPLTRPRTFFFRCPDCGAELLHTVDLSVVEDKPLEAPICRCGSEMKPAGIPQVMIPVPGGDGHTYEVEELKRT